MPALRDPLFLGVDFLNTKKTDRGNPGISVRVNLQRDDLIYVRSVKSRMEVVAFVDPETGLFITEMEETDPGSIYHKFRLNSPQNSTIFPKSPRKIRFPGSSRAVCGIFRQKELESRDICL